MTKRTAGDATPLRSRLGLHRGLVLLLLLGIAVAVLGGSMAAAQSPLSGTAATAQAETKAPRAGDLGPWDRAVAYVRQKQRQFQKDLATAVRTLRQERSFAAAWSLIVISFLYGVFHALGPGHGKAVISTYLLTQRSDLRKGLLLSWGGSLLQGLTAIALVFGAVRLIDLTQREAQRSVGTLESVSLALIALVGVGLVLRSLWSLSRAVAGRKTAEHAHDAHCGHNHGPSAEQIGRTADWRGSLSVIVSIGIRPCSGGVLVLLIATILNLQLAGIAAVLTMSIGTALTVSVLAVMAVSLQSMTKNLSRFDARSAAIAGHLASATGGLVIAALGTVLFFGSLGPSHPLL